MALAVTVVPVRLPCRGFVDAVVEAAAPEVASDADDAGGVIRAPVVVPPQSIASLVRFGHQRIPAADGGGKGFAFTAFILSLVDHVAWVISAKASLRISSSRSRVGKLRLGRFPVSWPTGTRGRIYFSCVGDWVRGFGVAFSLLRR